MTTYTTIINSGDTPSGLYRPDEQRPAHNAAEAASSAAPAPCTSPVSSETPLMLDAFADPPLGSVDSELEIIDSPHPEPQLIIDADPRNLLIRANDFLWHYNAKNGSIYFREGKLVEVTANENGDYAINPLTVPKLRRILESKGPWKDMDTLKTVRIANDDLKLILETPPERLDAVPPLKGLRTGAYIIKGRICAKKGYDAESRYYLTRDVDAPKVLENPTDDDICRAKEIIEDCLKDFRYDKDVDRENTILALATLIYRDDLQGPVPVWIVDKNNSGAGGTLLTQVVGTLAMGKTPSLHSFARSRDELEKSARTAIKSGDKFVIFDNIPAGSDWVSETLLSATSGTGEITFREMKTHNDVTVTAKMFFAANGINISIKADIVRRMFRTRLCSHHAAENMAFSRTKTELLADAAVLHPKILWSFATLYQSWRSAGYPMPEKKSGNLDEYPDWYQICVGLLSHAGYTHILENQYELQTGDDEENEKKAGFLHKLYQWKGLEPFTPLEMIHRLDGEHASCSVAEGLLNFADDSLIRAVRENRVKTEHIGLWLRRYLGADAAGCPYTLEKVRSSGRSTYSLREKG
ncbi:MAG TPA: hypothetical protein O0X42_03915 [Methanocorpusculum sp.]|nr:hypothetical protein [Methanocorpusculum sp.]